MALTYIIVLKNSYGKIIATGKGSSLNEAVDHLQNAYEDYTIEEAIKILSEETEKGEL